MERAGGLVVSSVEERALLTGKQKDVLVRFGLKYLQDRNVHINPKTVETAGEVMLDALDRGLRTQEKSFISEKESVTRFVRAGLKERDAIGREARTIIEEPNSSSVYGSFLGSTALPVGLVESAKKELVNFVLNPNVDNCEQLILFAKQRQEELENLLELAILQLPQEVQANARKRELTQDEKAKLVRNLITSVVFRNTQNPIITTDQLLEFNRLYIESPENFFTADDKKKVSDMGGYIGDLFEQTKEMFKESHFVSASSRDQLFKTFWRGLLLLHPALEEEPISINPGDIGKEDHQTLWDKGYSVEIEGFLVPKVEILIAAIRQSDAAGSIGRIRLLSEALHLWRQFEANKQNYPRRVENLANQVKIQKKRIEKLSKGTTLFLPKEDLEFANNAVKTAEIEVSKRRSAWRFATGTVARSRARVRRISVFKNRFEESLKKDGRIEIPRNIYIDLLLENVSDLSRNIAGFENRLTSIEERVRGVFGFERDLLDTHIKDMLNLDVYSGKQIRDLLVKELKIINTGTNSNVFNLDNPNVKRHAMSELSIITRSALARRRWGVGNLSAADLKRLDGYLKENLLSNEVLQIVSKATLQRLVNQLKPIVDGTLRVSRLKRSRNQIQKEINNIVAGAPVPRSAFADLKIVELYREAMISNFPLALGKKQSDEARRLIEIKDFDSLRAILPAKVDKRKFRKAILKYIKDGTLRYKNTTSRYSFERRAEAGKSFLELRNSSVFSLKYARGMETARYLDLLSRKILLIHRYFSIQRLKEEYDEGISRLKDISRQRDVVKNNLTLKHLESDYQALLNRKPETIFLESLRKLNLVAPAQSN